MRRPSPLPTLALALALVGCVEAPTAEELPGLVPPLPDALFLTSLMTLDTTADNETMAVRATPFFQSWQAGDDYPTWLADPPRGDFLVTSVNTTLYVRASGPVAPTGRFPDLLVYAGAGDAWMGYGSRGGSAPNVPGSNPYVPGTTYKIEIEVALPEGGLWVSPEAPLGLKVVPVVVQQDGSHLEILVGGDEASAIQIASTRIDVSRSGETRGNADGEVTGTMYAGPAAPDTTSQRIPLSIPPGASYLLAWMNTTESQGVPDLDLSLAAPDGTILASSGTPTPREVLRVAPLTAGDHELVVTTAGSPQARFRVEWTLGTG